ncbi:hypothetical protein QOZ80_5BG0423450 [Eleusine coracana subsp. coracana]|nr:hypothetical protein QOZ80_5BG0423450 [Eleusine coracana subsp. coracana]
MTGASSGSTHWDGKTGALRRTATALRLKFQDFARCFVRSQDPEQAPASGTDSTAVLPRAVKVTDAWALAPPVSERQYGPASAVQATLSLPDELLLEILVLLPPLPSSLPRASLVCKQWRRVLSEPSFIRRFCAHHRTPPLLGFIAGSGVPAFFPALAPPDRIPAGRFSPPLRPGESWRPLGCRHGLALFLDFSQAQVIVWDPVTDGQRRIPLPSKLEVNPWQDAYTGAVLVAAGDDGVGHLYAGDRMSSFRLVLVCCNNTQYRRAWACVYESKSGEWGNVSSVAVPYPCFPEAPAVLVGSALCWLLSWSGNAILEFDTESQSMAVTHIPSDTRKIDVADIQVVRTEDAGLGIVVQAKQCIQLWGRNAISDGGVEWVLQKTVWRNDLLSLKPPVDRPGSKHDKWLSGIRGYDEDTNLIVVATDFGTFMIQLDTIQITEIFGNHLNTKCHPYSSFYTAVTRRDDGIEILNNA